MVESDSFDQPVFSEDHTNPYRAPQFSEVTVERSAGHPSKWLRPLCLLQCLVIVGALAASFYDIESIVFSGPVLLISGCFAGVTGQRHHCRAAVWFGFSSLGISALTVLLINAIPWSPRDAQEPLPIIYCCYAAGILPVGLYAAFAQNRTDGPELSDFADIE